MNAWLRVTAGQDTGKTYKVTGITVTIGRSRQNAIGLHDERVSRRHMALRYSSNQHRAVDLQSSNGIFLNNVRVSEAPLRHGDHLLVGDTELRYEIGADLSYPEDHCRHQPSDPTDGPSTQTRRPSRIELEGISAPDPEPCSNGEDAPLHPPHGPSSDQRPEHKYGATENFGTFEELDRKRRKRHFSLVTRELDQLRSYDKLLKPITQTLLEELGVERVAILKRSGSRFMSSSFSQRPEVTYQSEAPPLMRDLIRACITQKNGLLVNTGSPLPRGGLKRGMAAFPAICVPVQAGERVEAVIYVDNVLRITRVYDASELGFVEALAAKLAAALATKSAGFQGQGDA